MADKGEVEENNSRGNDWEVVSLTASAYAASPGPKQVELKDDTKGDSHNKAETSQALFMSRHFAFPPSEHENLPLDPINAEIHDEKVKKDVESEFSVEQEGISHEKDKEDLTLKGLDLPDEFTGIQYLDEKDKNEESIYSVAALGSLHDETTILGSVCEVKDSSSEPTQTGSDLGTDVSPVPKHEQDDKHVESKMPCEAWWRRSAASLYTQAKEANAFCSIFIAAAVMGLVIIGQRWQQERSQILQLKWHSDISDEKSGRITGSILRLKEVIVGSHRRGSFTRTSLNDN